MNELHLDFQQSSTNIIVRLKFFSYHQNSLIIMQFIILTVWFRSPGVSVMVIHIISMFYEHILSWALFIALLFIFFLLKGKLLTTNLSTPFCLLLWTLNGWAWGRRDTLSGVRLCSIMRFLYVPFALLFSLCHHIILWKYFLSATYIQIPKMNLHASFTCKEKLWPG